MKETQLFIPVKILFESLGFEVEAEIEHIDMVAKKENRYIAIELKKELNVQVIAQVLKRQTLTDEAYIATFKPTKKVMYSKIYKDKLLILKRLGIGLITVDTSATIIKESEVVLPRKNKKKRKRLIETYEQLNKENVGGSHRVKRMTLYRKQAMNIAQCIGRNPKKATQIRKETGIDKSYSILYKNYYGWFEALGKGMYQLSDLGLKDNDI
jgi:hypothetical protein